MWVLIITLLEWTVIILAVTQVLIPILINQPIFWLFRKKKTEELNQNELDAEIKKTEARVIDLKKTVAKNKSKTEQELSVSKKRDDAAKDLL